MFNGNSSFRSIYNQDSPKNSNVLILDDRTRSPIHMSPIASLEESQRLTDMNSTKRSNFVYPLRRQDLYQGKDFDYIDENNDSLSDINSNLTVSNVK